jgi:hypothetical protein
MVEKLLTKAGADVRLNTQVTRIARVGNGTLSATTQSSWPPSLPLLLDTGYAVTTAPAAADPSRLAAEETEQGGAGSADRVCIATIREYHPASDDCAKLQPLVRTSRPASSRPACVRQP